MRVDVERCGHRVRGHRGGAARASSCTGSPTAAGCGATRSRRSSTPGFSTVVPDLRGYGASDQPAEVEAYSIPYPGRATSWPSSTPWASSAPTWWATTGGRPWPGRSGRCCPTASTTWWRCRWATRRRSWRRAYAQREKSWYMLLFQFEGIAEQWLSNNDWANLRAWGGHPDADDVIADLERHGSLTPALNWYRANVPPQRPAWSPPLELPPCRRPPWGCGAAATSPSPRCR